MTRLEGQAWLTDPRTRAVMDALGAVGGADCARFVGGCVRNALIGAPVDDVDIATRLTPDRVLEALTTAGLKAVPTGIDHGTVTAISGGRPFEITTLRRDVSTDGRNATVAFTDDWSEDAARRDFRLNALYADASGEVFDPTGRGIEDAREGRIVFVGDAETRIREDYLRILRFFRFFGWYGRGEADPAGLTACAALRDGMERLSAERVSKELLKLLAAPHPQDAVPLMAETGVLGKILPEAELELFDIMSGLSLDPLLRLSALLPQDPGTVDEVARRLRLSNAQRCRLTAAVGDTPPVTPDLTPKQARAAIYALGADVFQDRLYRAVAAEPARVQAAKSLWALARSWAPPTMPVGGRDLARLGVAAGPETGRILEAFEAGWIADDFPESGHEERLRELVERG